MSIASRLLNEQTVVVTGGARGLGASISEAFLREGANVVINYLHSADAAAELVRRYPASAFAACADIRDRDAVAHMIKGAADAFGTPVTTVVNNALADFTFNGDARVHADVLEYDDVAAQFAGSVQGPLNLLACTRNAMASSGFGRIVNIGTNLFQNPVVPYHDYTAAKAALLSLTRTLAHDLGPAGITVNMVSGGLLRTTDASAATPEAVFDLIAGSTPLRSVISPQELADAVLFFASPWARAITGQNLIVDGGLVAG